MAAITTLLLSAPVAVHAVGYEDNTLSLGASEASLPSGGGPLTLTAGGLCPNKVVTFSVAGVVLGSATTNSLGSASLTIPDYKPVSDNTFSVRQDGSAGCENFPKSMTLPVVASLAPVPPSAGGGSGGTQAPVAAVLPTTGAESASGLQIAAMLFAAGAGLVGVSVFRRRSASGRPVAG